MGIKVARGEWEDGCRGWFVPTCFRGLRTLCCLYAVKAPKTILLTTMTGVARGNINSILAKGIPQSSPVSAEDTLISHPYRPVTRESG